LRAKVREAMTKTDGAKRIQEAFAATGGPAAAAGILETRLLTSQTPHTAASPITVCAAVAPVPPSVRPHSDAPLPCGPESGRRSATTSQERAGQRHEPTESARP